MNRAFAILGVVCLAVLLIGAMVDEDKFTLKIYQWAGLDSDEPFSVDMLHPKDLWNMEIGNEGGKTYIQQRRGMQRILMDDADSIGDEIRAIIISQITGDSERVVVYTDNWNVYQTTGNGDWNQIDAGGVAQDTFNNFLLFKDTLLFAAGDSVHKFGVSSGDLVQVDARADDGWAYNRLFLHQDRVYGYGTNDNNNTEIAWMPEFDIDFRAAHFDSQVALGFAGTANVGRDDGDFLTAVLPMGEHIIAYKSRSIYKILVSPTSNAPVEIIKMADNTGAYGYDAAISWNNQHFFVAEDGVYINNGASIQKISEPIDFWFRDSLTHSTGQAKIFKLAVYDNKLFVTLPIKQAATASSVAGYREFVYDLDIGVWSKWRMATQDGKDRETHWVLRYEYNPFSAAPLTGAKFLKQRLILVRDSSTTIAGVKDVCWIYPSDSYLSDGDSLPKASYTTPLSPLTDMWKRKQIERVVIYGEAAVTAGDSATGNVLYINNESGTVDSLYFSITSSPFFFNKRLRTTAVGDLIGIKLEIRDTNRVKINALELMGMEKGLGNETD